MLMLPNSCRANLILSASRLTRRLPLSSSGYGLRTMTNLVKENSGGEEAQLPKLSAAEFRIYNRMAEHMDYFVSTCFPPLATS